MSQDVLIGWNGMRRNSNAGALKTLLSRLEIILTRRIIVKQKVLFIYLILELFRMCISPYMG